MSTNNISRKVVRPDIVQARIEAQDANNVWNYVTAINNKLRTNPINVDYSITIKFYWSLEQTMIDQIVEIYQGEGWLVEVSQVGTQVQTFPGETTFDFIPPTPKLGE